MSQSEEMPKPLDMHPHADQVNSPTRVHSSHQGLSWFTWLLLVVLAGVVGWIYWQDRSNAVSSAVQWRTDYQAALSEAQQAGKPVLLDFTADWCPPCRQMKRDVWSDSSLAQVVHEAAVPVLMDIDRSAVRPIAQRFGVEFIPTIILIDANGNEIRRAGPMSSSEVREFLGLR